MSRISFASSLASVSLLFLLSTASTAQPGTRPVDIIQDADQAWMTVFAAKNLEKSVAFCSDNGAILAPNSPIATGHDAISKLIAAFFALPNLKISWHPDRAEVAKSGELGYTSGAYEMTFTDPSGKTIPDKGKYVTVWKKQTDGSWKVMLDIFNTDMPQPSM